MPYSQSYYRKPKKLLNTTFNNLIGDDLENKRAYLAKYPTYCSKCGKDIEEGKSFYYYAQGQKICISCHEEAIDWCKNTIF